MQGNNTLLSLQGNMLFNMEGSDVFLSVGDGNDALLSTRGNDELLSVQGNNALLTICRDFEHERC